MRNASEIDAMVNTDYYLKNLQEIKRIFIDSLQDLNKFPMDSSESFLKEIIQLLFKNKRAIVFCAVALLYIYKNLKYNY